jgi:hypothetical protein
MPVRRPASDQAVKARIGLDRPDRRYVARLRRPDRETVVHLSGMAEEWGARLAM